MFKFLLVVHALIAASMVGVILMQRSEGGGLAGGGSPTGLMSARGAADFLTRTTAILASLFIMLSIGLAALATVNRRAPELDRSLDRKPVSAPGALPGIPMGGATTPVAPGTAAAPLAPVPEATVPTAATPALTSQPRTQTEQTSSQRTERRPETRTVAPKAQVTPAPTRVTPPKIDTAAPTFKLEPKPTPSPSVPAPVGPPANAAGTPPTP
jgi:preprotein translocase subunit SecG